MVLKKAVSLCNRQPAAVGSHLTPGNQPGRQQIAGIFIAYHNTKEKPRKTPKPLPRGKKPKIN